MFRQQYKDSIETGNEELSQINDWFLANKLSLNVQKKYMLFHKLTNQENIPLKLSSLQLNGNIIERENPLKFLGVIFVITWENIHNLLIIRSSKMLVFFIKQIN